MIAGMAARGMGLRRAAACVALGGLIAAGTLAAAGAATEGPSADPAEWERGFAEALPAWVFKGVIEPSPPARPKPPGRPKLWENHAQVRPGDPEHEEALSWARAGDERRGQPVVVLDPGHGGGETGAHMHGRGEMDEAESNLRFALNLRTVLQAAGVHVVLTREDAGLATLNFTEAPGRADLHARAEMAHFAQADLFVSIHSNGRWDESTRGLEVWYVPGDSDEEGDREFPLDDGENLAFAELMLASIGAELDAYGYRTPQRLKDGSCIDDKPGFCDPLYVPAPFILLDASVAREWGRGPAELGLSEDRFAPSPPVGERVMTPAVHKYHGPIDLTDPATQTGPAKVMRGTLMPMVLVELLYMTNPHEAWILQQPAARAAMVRGMEKGILAALRERGKLPEAEPGRGSAGYPDPGPGHFPSLR